MSISLLATALVALIFFIAAIAFYRRSLILKLRSDELENELSKEKSFQLQLKVDAEKIANLRQETLEELYVAKAQVQALEKDNDQQTQQYQAVIEQMKDSFRSLAHQTLEGQTKQFLELAQQTLSVHTELAKSDLDKRQTSIDNMVAPLRTTLESLQKQTQEIEKDRQRAFTTVESELKRVVENSATLSQETRALKDALKKPHVRGRWGEVQLKNCIELAGMSEFADVHFQDYTEVDDGQRFIPDLTVKMPGGRLVIVDAKTPIDAFISSLEANTEEERTVEMRRHGLQVKEHVKKLSLKSYNEKLKDTADFTVMFLPNESFLYAALETQPDLVEYALEKKILIATPPTFIGLLKVIRYGWSEERLAFNAERIRDVGMELHKRVVEFVDTYVAVGKYLGLANDKYEEGLKRLTNRVIVQARKMEALGAKSAKELPESMGFELPDTDD